MSKEAWYATRASRCGSSQCRGRRGPLVVHHVTLKQHVAASGGDIWDPRNALTLCNGCHLDHHAKIRKLLLRDLPDSAFEFAAECLGPGPAFVRLGKHYVGGDPRWSALVEPEGGVEVA